MRVIPWLFVLAVVMLLSGCGEPEADMAVSKKHLKDGIAFQHPGNWKITEATAEEGFHHVMVETPGDALVIVQLFPADGAATLKEYADAFSAAATEEAPAGVVSKSKFAELDPKEGWSRSKETFVIQVLGVKVNHTRLYHARDFGHRRCFVLCQVADEDLSKVEEGSSQIFSTPSITN
jgi:hypothetical protein